MVGLDLKDIFTGNFLLHKITQILSLPVLLQTVKETLKRKRNCRKCRYFSENHSVSCIFFATVTKLGADQWQCTECIEFQLAQGQGINVPFFTLFQVVCRKQAAK